MEKITLILEDIDRLCNHVTKGHELTEDLKQEVILTMLETYGDCERYELNELRKIAAKIIYTMWFSDGVMNDKYTNTKSFYYKYKTFGDLAPYELQDYLLGTEEQIEVTERIEQILKSNKLTQLDKEILKQYLRRNCKISQFAIDAGVDRYQLTKRINKILDKCRKIL